MTFWVRAVPYPEEVVMNTLLKDLYFTPGTINLLGGGPYSGKTTLLRTLLKACHERTQFFGLDTLPLASWCHVVSDRDQEVFLDDCRKLKIPLPTVAHLWNSVGQAEKKQHGNNFKLNGHSYARVWLRRQLQTWAEQGELTPGGLVTLDTAMPFVPDARSYAESWLAAQELRDMAGEYEITLLLICHAGKYKPMQSASTPWERIQVSMALIGCTDTTLYICSPLETAQSKFDGVEAAEGIQLITLKGRQADSHYWTGRIKFEAGSTLMIKVGDAGSISKGGERLGAGRPLKVTEDKLLELVGPEPISIRDLLKEIINSCDVVEMTARSAINRAVNTGILIRQGDTLSLPTAEEA